MFCFEMEPLSRLQGPWLFLGGVDIARNPLLSVVVACHLPAVSTPRSHRKQIRIRMAHSHGCHSKQEYTYYFTRRTTRLMSSSRFRKLNGVLNHNNNNNLNDGQPEALKRKGVQWSLESV
jgi:hypothetical protein